MPDLASLELSSDRQPLALIPDFDPTIRFYRVEGELRTAALEVAASSTSPAAKTIINGASLGNGEIGTVALQPGSNTIEVVIETPGPKGAKTSYSIQVTRAKEEVKQTAVASQITEPLDSFGWSVAMSGDTLAIGAIGESSKATGVAGKRREHADNSSLASGAVYVFARNPSGRWFQEAYLKASNANPRDHFGASVSLWGDTLVVGATGEDGDATANQATNTAPRSGAVYVFQRDVTGWHQQAYLKASNADPDDQFGSAVSLFEDTLVVGAPYESSKATGVDASPEEQADNQALSSGAAYVFERTGSTWSQQAYIKASNTSAQDSFGLSVAAFGNTIAVGAPEQSTSASGVPANEKAQDGLIEESGAVFVFERAGATWVQQAYLKAAHPSIEAWFGSSLALSVNTLAIGAPGESIGSGAVYIFERTGTAWSQKAHLKSSNASDGGSFGSSLALSNDTLAVGAVGESSSIVRTRRRLRAEVDDREESGAGYVFRRTGSAWSQQAYIVASNAEQFDRLGASVALFDNNLVFGAIGEDSNATGVAVSPAKHLDSNDGDDAGAAYLFNRKNGKWSESAYLKAFKTDDSHVP